MNRSDEIADSLYKHLVTNLLDKRAETSTKKGLIKSTPAQQH